MKLASLAKPHLQTTPLSLVAVVFLKKSLPPIGVITFCPFCKLIRYALPVGAA
jgi:hypothetical protein